MTWNDPIERDTGDLITAAIWNQDVVANARFLNDNSPQTGLLLHRCFEVTAGGGLSVTADSGQHFAHWAYQNPYALNDAGRISLPLLAGSYTLCVLGRAGGASGIMTVSLDGVALTPTLDWYGAGVLNTLKSIGGVTVSSSGRHLLSYEITGKNASSSGHAAEITAWWFLPSAYTRGV